MKPEPETTMDAETMVTGMLVEVLNEMTGYVEWVNADGTIAVKIIGEGNRVDYWHPTQVKAI